MKTEPTDEQLNIAVCKWLGWHVFNGYLCDIGGGSKHHQIESLRGVGDVSIAQWLEAANYSQLDANLPNHITGIEALGHIHEAEKLLSEAETTAYIDELERVTRENGMVRAVERRLTKAEPRHKAIALLSVVSPEVFA